MINNYLLVIGKKKIELFLISCCIVLILVRTTFPVLKYPFIIIYLILGFYILLKKKSKLFSDFKRLRNLPITLIVLFLYIVLASLFSDKIYLSVIKDIINIIIITTIMLMILVFADNKNDLKTLYDLFLKLLVFFALVISLHRIYTYLYVSSYQDSILHSKIEETDTNFATLPVFFGMAACLYFLLRETKGSRIFIYNIILFVCSLNILLSGSRRGIVIFLLFYLSIFFIQLWGIFGKYQIIKRLFKNTSSYFASFSIFIILLLILILKTSIYFKNEVLDGLGIENKAHIKVKVIQTLFSYSHLIRKDIDEDSIYNRIWQPVYDPKDPDAGTGNGNYKIVKILSGKNLEIVPEGSKGYLLDKTCIGDSSLTHAYYFHLLKTLNVEAGDSIVSSVYCYVSDDFNGTAAAFRVLGALEGNSDVYYDLNNKGSWQKLIMPVNCNTGELRIYLYMNKGGVRNFSSLKGHVIFAYPEYYRESKEIIINGSLINNAQKIGDTSSLVGFRQENFFMNRNFHQLSKIDRANILSFPFLGSAGFCKIAPHTDHIRSLIAKIVSEDTAYQGYNAIVGVSGDRGKFGDDRVSRWKFALEIYSKEYNFTKKIFGGGFNFLNWYGYHFLNDRTKTDYPHNPFLHILLYSGIIGLFIYLLFLYQVFYYYIKFCREFPLLFVFFILTFYFTLFSGGSPFDPPIMGFFIILPLVINIIYTREKLI